MCDAFTFANVRAVIQAVADYVISHDMRDRGVLVGGMMPVSFPADLQRSLQKC